MTQETKQMKPTVLDRKQLANRWGCSIPTIKRREKEGLLHPVYLSTRLVRYRIADIESIESIEACEL